jgi:putative redox protein
MEAKATWSSKLTFTGTAGSGFTIPLGAEAAVGGDEDGFRPMELMALCLAACTAMDVISILIKKRQQVSSFEVHVGAKRADSHPRVFTEMHVEYRITGEGIQEAAVERAIELSETKYCPAQAMLQPVVPISHSYVIG